MDRRAGAIQDLGVRSHRGARAGGSAVSQQAQPVAVVTGANRGIGRAIAVGYANAGYAVAALA